MSLLSQLDALEDPKVSTANKYNTVAGINIGPGTVEENLQNLSNAVVNPASVPSIPGGTGLNEGSLGQSGSGLSDAGSENTNVPVPGSANPLFTGSGGSGSVGAGSGRPQSPYNQ